MGAVAGAAFLSDVTVLEKDWPGLFGMTAAAGFLLGDTPQILGV